MERNTTFTEGKILQPLILFAMPVLFALFLQAMYGAVDLLVVGKFASSADVSAVSTGSQIMMTLTNLISSFAMGTTVLLGQLIGCGKKEEGGKAVGMAMVMFAGIALVMTVLLVCFAPQISSIMHAPKEAFDKTAAYVRICGCGMIVIVAYNLIGCIFRGIGDSKMPLFTVAIACVCNIAGDLVLCAGFHMGTAGAACATVFAQVVSVVVSFGFIRKKQLPFVFKKENVRIHKTLLKKMAGLGAPIALQDLLVSISFLIILAIVNSMGVTASAGVGVAEKVCAFIMLISSAFMQSMSAFVAQNYGAGRMDRAKKALYNGIGQTKFVMLQGIAGAFGVRVPVSYLMSLRPDTSLFKIGLATPMSSVVQLLLCLGFMVILNRRNPIRKTGKIFSQERRAQDERNSLGCTGNRCDRQ